MPDDLARLHAPGTVRRLGEDSRMSESHGQMATALFRAAGLDDDNVQWVTLKRAIETLPEPDAWTIVEIPGQGKWRASLAAHTATRLFIVTGDRSDSAIAINVACRRVDAIERVDLVWASERNAQGYRVQTKAWTFAGDDASLTVAVELGQFRSEPSSAEVFATSLAAVCGWA
jgi:hypothetical protein